MTSPHNLFFFYWNFSVILFIKLSLGFDFSILFIEVTEELTSCNTKTLPAEG